MQACTEAASSTQSTEESELRASFALPPEASMVGDIHQTILEESTSIRIVDTSSILADTDAGGLHVLGPVMEGKKLPAGSDQAHRHTKSQKASPPWEQKSLHLREQDMMGLLEARLMEQLQEANDPSSALAKEVTALVERIIRAGEMTDMHHILHLNSFLVSSELCSITRHSDRMLATRALNRAKLPGLETRIAGKYMLNNYAIERMRRADEATHGIDVKYYTKHISKLLPTGYTKRFRSLVLTMSFFSMAHIGRIAASDFLRSRPRRFEPLAATALVSKPQPELGSMRHRSGVHDGHLPRAGGCGGQDRTVWTAEQVRWVLQLYSALPRCRPVRP